MDYLPEHWRRNGFDGKLLPTESSTGDELARERKLADKAEARADRLAGKLRMLGYHPDA